MVWGSSESSCKSILAWLYPSISHLACSCTVTSNWSTAFTISPSTKPGEPLKVKIRADSFSPTTEVKHDRSQLHPKLLDVLGATVSSELSKPVAHGPEVVRDLQRLLEHDWTWAFSPKARGQLVDARFGKEGDFVCGLKWVDASTSTPQATGA